MRKKRYSEFSEERKSNVSKYITKYQSENYKTLTIRVSIESDKDIIEYLEGKSNRTEYIKSLIRRDMEGSV